MKFNKPYDKRDRVHPILDSESMTHQSFKDLTDVNAIVSKWQNDGVCPSYVEGMHYGDFEKIDFQESMNHVISVQTLFDSLPSSVRNQCKNDPSQFLEMIKDESILDDLIESGIVDKSFKSSIDNPVVSSNSSTIESDSIQNESGQDSGTVTPT